MFRILGDPNQQELKRLQPLVLRIGEYEEAMRACDDAGLRKKTEEFRGRLSQGLSLDDLLPEAFAAVREAAKRTLKQRHFDVQLIGGIVLHQGKIAEMRTGEGKTLSATAPAYVNALTGKGAHIITVNDYLAKRDAAWMGQIYDALGMSVGCVAHEGAFRYRNPVSQEEFAKDDAERDTKGSFEVEKVFLEPCTKREAYACDVTYGTNNEFGFDYLRDNMALQKEQVVQRGHHFAIVDEVDSILIDEARTPLIISAPDVESPKWYDTFSRLAPRLKENDDYNLDEKRKAVLVTEEGVKKVEGWLGIGNLYEEGLRLVHYLEQALRAHVLFQRDRDYIVREGEVIIVDEFTGRLMPGRRWSDGLHQAVEAKEGVKVQAESRTLATITFQNYFRLYEKLSGMTGTAATSAEEFHKVYSLEVVIVPTNRPMIRHDQSDLVFRSREGKWKALVRAVREKHDRGQPILIGTTSIEKNEILSAMLSRDGVPHEVLNAKQHEREGAIIAQAGRFGAVTVATNMAGRGVDIVLGGNPPDTHEADRVRESGGLAIFGTERHEARRIDNQLRGRSGRQGDPGESQFYLSLEDDLLRVFGGDRLKNLMARLDLPEDQPIESGIVSKAIEAAQGRIEGQNFDIRKHLLDYDDVANKHRETIYRWRRKILNEGNALEDFLRLFKEEIAMLASVHLAGDYSNEWNVEEFSENLKALFPVPEDIHAHLLAITERGEVAGLRAYGRTVSVSMLQDAAARREAVIEWSIGAFEKACEIRKEQLGEENFILLAQQVMLRAIDTLWVEHLETMEALRDAVRLRAYGQRDPLVEYKTESARTFRQLEAAIRARAVQMLFRAQMRREVPQTGRFADQQMGRAGGIQANRDVQKRDQSANLQIRKSAGEPGRNDPCPCGAVNPASGKPYKYKQCGLINAPHHRE